MSPQDDKYIFILGRIEGKVDQMMKSQNRINQQDSEELENLGKRVRKLEGYKSYLLGAVAVCSALFSFMWDRWTK